MSLREECEYTNPGTNSEKSQTGTSTHPKPAVPSIKEKQVEDITARRQSSSMPLGRDDTGNLLQIGNELDLVEAGG